VDDRTKGTAGERVGIPHGGSALLGPWEVMEREVRAAYGDLSQEHQDRVIGTVALGRRAYSWVSSHGGGPVEIVAAKKIDALAEACDIHPTD